MKYKIVTLGILCALVISCSEKIVKQNQPFKLVNSKSEFKSESTLDLYTYTGSSPINLAIIKKFCKFKKSKWNLAGFYKFVIFDAKENAIMTKFPVTSAYDSEIKLFKHIKAVFTLNKINGYSKLDYYEKNKSESSAQSIKI